MTLKLTYAGFNYVADVDGSYDVSSLSAMVSQTASNSVALTADYGIDAATNSVYADYSSGGSTGSTESIADITAQAQAAEAAGLTVTIRPLVDFLPDASAATLTGNGNTYADGDWRAYYNPGTVANGITFLKSYEQTVLLPLAAVAQKVGAQVFDLGTEIDQLTGPAYQAEWDQIISDVRAVYSGKLTYSAIGNDDDSTWQYGNYSDPNIVNPPAAGTGNIATQVSFWNKVDYVGIDEYSALSNADDASLNGTDPTLQQLVNAWEQPFTDDGQGTPTDGTADQTNGESLIQYYESIATATGKPLLFTELGYNSAPDAASQPFFTSSGSYDPALQAELYKAFLQAWSADGNTSLQGVYLWNWEPNPATVGAGTDPSWTPQGNTAALQVLQAGFSAAEPAAAGTTNPDAYSWIAAGSGAWGVASNWADVTTGTNPAAIAPGLNDFVAIAGGSSSADTISGNGNAATLTTTEQVTFSGTFVTNVLTVGTAAADTTTTDAAQLQAGSATIVDGTLAAIAGGAISVTGALTLGGAAATNASDYQTLTATGGGTVLVAGLTLGKTVGFYTNSYVYADANSAIEVGTAGGASDGAVTVDAGHTLGGAGTIGTNVYDFGTLSAQGGTLYVEGLLNGVGTAQIGTGSTLDAQAATGSISFAGADGTLVLHPGSAANQGEALQPELAGFAAGDTIDLAGATVTSISYVSTGANTGDLDIFDGQTSLGTIYLTGAYTTTHFSLTPDAAGTGFDIGISKAADDFNGDGKSDLLLQNDNGSVVIATQANLAVTGAVAVGDPGPTWHVVGSADFNGDGQADILLQNNSGAVVDYLMNGTSVAAVNALGSPGTSWHVRGSGDFSSNGQADILLQNDNGSMVVWNTNGTAVIGATAIGSTPAGWTVEGVGDFNGDGHPDVLVQNTNGSLVDYLMNGTTITAANALGNPGAGWAVVGTGDYNGDGRADIVLHNDNGSNVLWETNGTAITNSLALDTTSPAWTGTVAGVDLNGDGTPDLIVQNKDSTLVGYTTNGSGVVAGAAQLAVPGVGWHAIGNTPMQFIDGTQAVSGVTATPGADQFDFTSSMPGSHAITGFDPAQDSVALSSALFANYAAMQAHEAPYIGGTLIALSSTANVVIQGVTPSQLDSSNFAFR